jgi:hypothetical protein
VPAPAAAPAPAPEHAISLLNRSERYEERKKRAKVAEAELPQQTFKARSVRTPMMISPDDRPELAENLEKEKSLKVIPVKADDNCMFRALAHLLFKGDEECHANVRAVVCDELEADPEGVYSKRFTPRIGDYRKDRCFAEYVTRMRQLEEWGGDPELAAAAKIFGFKIHVHHPFFPNGVQVIQVPEAKEVDVHLVYYGDHYDVAYHESRPFIPGVEEEEASVHDDGDGGFGDGETRAYCQRGHSKTGRRLSSIRLPGMGLSKSSKSSI